MKYINHYNLGANTVIHKGKTLVTSDVNQLYNYLNLLQSAKIEIGYIPAGFEHRPDLISHHFYGTVTKDWAIMYFNNITDPFQQLNIGDRLLIPKI